MIRQANRFHGYHAVPKLRGSVEHSKHFSLRYAKSKRRDYRLAVVVSKKIMPKAIARNRIRRQVFEIVRTSHRFDNLPIDAVIYVKADSVQNEVPAELSKELVGLSTKALSHF